jgi:hypothetical protein
MRLTTNGCLTLVEPYNDGNEKYVAITQNHPDLGQCCVIIDLADKKKFLELLDSAFRQVEACDLENEVIV